jgi:hypothetical protein
MRPVATLLAVTLFATAATAAGVDVGAIDQKEVKKDALAAPKKDDKPPAVELKGTLQAKVAKGEKRNVYFAVYPLGKDGKGGTYWWVQGEVTKDGETVTCDAQFGEEDAGSGEYFAVVAIATERKWSVGEKLDDLPADAAFSKVVVAKRK